VKGAPETTTNKCERNNQSQKVIPMTSQIKTFNKNMALLLGIKTNA
jgi:hypothetical protein